MILFGCLLAFGAAFAPRIVLVLAWIFSSRWQVVWRGEWFGPLLGIIFLPYTTIMYTLTWSAGGIHGWEWMWIILGVILDIMKWSQIANNRRGIPGYPQSATGGGATAAAAPITPAAAAPLAPAAVAATAATVAVAAPAKTEPPVQATAAPAAATAASVAVAATAKAEPPVEEVLAPAAEAGPSVAGGAAVLAAAPSSELPMTEAALATHLQQLETTMTAGDMSNLREKVEYVEGIGTTFGSKLNQVGIVTVMDLLQRGATRKGRAKLVEETGIYAGLILTWTNHCDLFRIKGVGKQFAELLEAAGVDTVVELAQRNPVNLYTRMVQVNMEKKLAGRSPRQDEVHGWVEQAKGLPRVVEY